MDIPGLSLVVAPDLQPGICESVLKSKGFLCYLLTGIVL